jgi:hypothetical protein
MAISIAPKSDQPRVTTEALKRGDSSPTLQYRNTAPKDYTRNSASTRSYGRTKR